MLGISVAFDSYFWGRYRMHRAMLVLCSRDALSGLQVAVPRGRGALLQHRPEQVLGVGGLSLALVLHVCPPKG